jgi:RNA polymerase sigma factor (sigma-70 family)
MGRAVLGEGRMLDDGDGTNRRIRDEEKFVSLAAQARPGLLAVIRSAGVIEEGVAEDIVQEALLHAWAYRDFDPSRFGAASWLRTTALRIAIGLLRSRGSAWVSLDAMNAALREEGSLDSLSRLMIDTAARDPLGEAIRRERVEVVSEALRRLPSQQRNVLIRFYLKAEGTQAQIAESMGISLPAFNSLLNRARVAVKKHLESMRSENWRY